MAVVCGLAPISVGVRLFSSRCLTRAPYLNTTLIRLDVGGLGDLRPARDLLAHPGIELLRRVPKREDAEIADLVAELRRVHHGANIGGQPVEHRRGHARWGDKGVERNDV